jgi:hypothetical protein
MSDHPHRPDPETVSDRAERLQRRRSRLLLVSGVAFVSWIGSFSAGRFVRPEHLRLVDMVQLAAFAAWAVALLTLLATGGQLARDPAVRRIIDDELTRAHRRGAFVLGYWALLGATAGFYAVALFKPVAAAEALPILLALGVATPALNFALLERRAARDG